MGKFQPCKDCKDRVLKCHSTCEDYKNFMKECENIRRRRQEENSKYTVKTARQMSHSALSVLSKKEDKRNGTD